MALVSASRFSELQSLDLRFRVFKPEGVLFKMVCLTKKRKLGAPLKECFFGAFQGDKMLCVVKCLWQYERKTLQTFRQQRAGAPNPLFISYVKPHKPVTSQRITHWVKDTLKLAGVDTSVFSAHSVRGASTSMALTKGVHLADVLAVADWSRDSTFKPFIIGHPQETAMQRRFWVDWRADTLVDSYSWLCLLVHVNQFI